MGINATNGMYGLNYTPEQATQVYRNLTGLPPVTVPSFQQQPTQDTITLSSQSEQNQGGSGWGTVAKVVGSVGLLAAAAWAGKTGKFDKVARWFKSKNTLTDEALKLLKDRGWTEEAAKKCIGDSRAKALGILNKNYRKTAQELAEARATRKSNASSWKKISAKAEAPAAKTKAPAAHKGKPTCKPRFSLKNAINLYATNPKSAEANKAKKQALQHYIKNGLTEQEAEGIFKGRVKLACKARKHKVLEYEKMRIGLIEQALEWGYGSPAAKSYADAVMGADAMKFLKTNKKLMTKGVAAQIL